MNYVNVIFVFLNILKLCVSLDTVWHSYQFDPVHQSREELVISNLTSDDTFRLDYRVTKWKSVRVEKTYYLAGLMQESVAIASVTLNSKRNGFLEESHVIKLSAKPVDVALFQHWNTTSQTTDVIAVIATQKPELLWFRIEARNHSMFWSWPIEKNIAHINVFRIEYDWQILIITEYNLVVTGDLYQFELAGPNFWLRQYVELLDTASTSAVLFNGPDCCIAIPQKSAQSLQVYKLSDNHFVPFTNFSSTGVTEVISFNMGYKQFLAFNGINAGIYGFAKDGLRRESIKDSHFEGVNFWLPIYVSRWDETVLIAQRSLEHGFHNSFAVEVITYDGVRFEKHEDVLCSYFGENVLGLSCLPGEESKSGIVGSTSISLDDALGIVVPRDNSFSELFMVRFDVRQVANPVQQQLEQFVKQKQYLDTLITAQEEKYKEMEMETRSASDLDALKSNLDEIHHNITVINEQLSEQLSSLENPKHYSAVIFNGPVEIQSDAIFDQIEIENIKKVPAHDVLADIVLKNSTGVIRGTKMFADIFVEDIVVEQVNKINATDLIFGGDNLTISNNLILEQPLHIMDNATVTKLNGIFFDKEVVHLNALDDDLVFDNVEVLGDLDVDKLNNDDIRTSRLNAEFAELFVPANIQVTNVNGENFDELLRQIRFRNITDSIPNKTIVEGEVRIKGDASTKVLNGLKFPLEYVFSHDTSPNITGTKHFANILSTSEINCEGTVDDIDTSSIITLSTEQNVPGKTIFKKLKITESLNVTGNVTGEDASKFLPNPTLLETDIVKAKVHFRNLNVEGRIVLSQDLNRKNFENLLKNVVYKSDNETVIRGMKQFPEGFTVRKDLLVNSNSINDISLSSVVTKDTDQVLNITKLEGIISMGNVQVDGLYDSTDVKELDDELVKLNGEQYISSTFVFEDDISFDELDVGDLINDLNQDHSLSQNFSDNDSKRFDSSNVENIIVEGSLFGTLHGFDLENFDRHRMSFTKDQQIEADYTIKTSSIDNMNVIEINNVDEYDFSDESFEEKIKSGVLEGKIGVENLYARDSLEIVKINDRDTMNLGGSLWKNDVNKYNLTKLSFNANTYFESISIEKLSGVPFSDYISDIIFKNQTEVELAGCKTFLKGIAVKKIIGTKELNSIQLSNILTKHGAQEVSSPVTIRGDVIFENNVTIFENVNSVPVHFITDTYQASDDVYQVKGDILFSHLAHIHNLQIQGHVNNRLAQEFTDGIIYKDRDCKLGGRTTFESEVHIEGNVTIGDNINDIDLSTFVSNTVMITRNDNIKCPVKFTGPVEVEGVATLHENLKIQDLNGLDLDKWKERAVFVNRGYLRGNYTFDHIEIVDKLLADSINGVDLHTLIPLRSEQNLTELIFNEINVYNDIDVGYAVNSHNLLEEFENTVLINSVEDIDSDVEFLGNVYVEGDVQLKGLLNNMDPNKIVTTNTDQVLRAVYNFRSKVVVEQNFIVERFVNGINITSWFVQSVKISDPQPQTITDNWIVDHDLILKNDSSGDGLINGIDFQGFRQDIEAKRNYKYALEKGLIEDYENMCRDLTYMYDKVRKQIYKFNYLEILQKLKFRNKIQHVYHFEHNNNFFLLISEERVCETHFFTFDSHFRFVRTVSFGLVSQIISVRHTDRIYVVVRNHPVYSLCKVQGTNVWELMDDDFVHKASMEDQDLLQESSVQATFYGVSGHAITEFRISDRLEPAVRKCRKWVVKEENMAFVPKGLATGLAIRTGTKLVVLNRDEAIIEDFSHEIETTIRGNFTEEFNMHLPGRKDGDLAVLKVGIKSTRKSLLAVANHEETSIKGSSDFIKIYEDVVTGKVFHKLTTYKPSSLISLEFNNGETLLVFMEDESVLQVYEYKGIQGFKHKLSSRLEGSSLVAMTMPDKRKFIGVVDKNSISFIECMMLGNRVQENLRCSL